MTDGESEIDEAAKIFDDHTLSTIKLAVRRLVLAGIDVGILAVAIAVHKCIEILAAWALPSDWELVLKGLQAVFGISFGLVYIHLSYDFVCIFIPQLRGKSTNPKLSTAPASSNVSGTVKSKGVRK